MTIKPRKKPEKVKSKEVKPQIKIASNSSKSLPENGIIIHGKVYPDYEDFEYLKTGAERDMWEMMMLPTFLGG